MYMLMERKEKRVKTQTQDYYETERRERQMMEEEMEAQEKIRVEKEKKKQQLKIEMELEKEKEKQRKLEEEREKIEQERKKQIQIQVQLEQERRKIEKEAEKKQQEQEIEKVRRKENDLKMETAPAKEQKKNEEEQKILRKLLEMDSEVELEQEDEKSSSESFTEKADCIIQEAKTILQTEDADAIEMTQRKTEPVETASERVESLLIDAENLLLDLNSKKSETRFENQVTNLTGRNIKVDHLKQPLAVEIFTYNAFTRPRLLFSHRQKVGNYFSEDFSSISSESSEAAENHSTEEILTPFKKYKQKLIESFEKQSENENETRKDEDQKLSSESDSSKLSTPPPSFEKATAFQNLDLDSDIAIRIPLLIQMTENITKTRDPRQTKEIPVIEKENHIFSPPTNLSDNYGENLMWGQNTECDCCPLLTCIFTCLFSSLK